MYQTMTQIGKAYDVDAKVVGQVLYDLNIRDKNHPEQKGFPYEQAVVHGIAKAYTGRTGDIYYRYDIDRMKSLLLHPKRIRPKARRTTAPPRRNCGRCSQPSTPSWKRERSPVSIGSKGISRIFTRCSALARSAGHTVSRQSTFNQ